MPLTVNPWAVLLAATAGWMVGAGYYTLLAQAWVSALGTTMEHLAREQAQKAGTPAVWMPFLFAFLAELVMAWVLAGIIVQANAHDFLSGVATGALAWLGLVASTMAVNNLFAGRKLMLTVVDGGHWLLVLLVMGAILGVFA
jgi:hypothetical protein